MRSLHIFLNTTHSGCQPGSSISSLTHSLQVFQLYPHISPLPPPHFYRPTTNRLHSHAPHVKTTSIYRASPPQPHSEPSKECTNPQCAFYPSATPPHIHLNIIRSVLSRLQICYLHRPGFSPICQYTLDSGHKPCISLPSCGMMHPELSGYEITPWT